MLWEQRHQWSKPIANLPNYKIICAYLCISDTTVFEVTTHTLVEFVGCFIGRQSSDWYQQPNYVRAFVLPSPGLRKYFRRGGKKQVRPRRQGESIQNTIFKSRQNHEHTVPMVTYIRIALTTIIHGRETLVLPVNLIIIQRFCERGSHCIYYVSLIT